MLNDQGNRTCHKGAWQKDSGWCRWCCWRHAGSRSGHKGTRATIRPGRWLGDPEKVGSDGDARRVIVLQLGILRFQQSASLICRLAALSKKSQSHHASKSAVLLHSLREFVVRVELFLQLEARCREFDCGTNSLQSLNVVLEFLSEVYNGLVLQLFGDKQFAKSGDNLDKRDLIIVYPTAQLVERRQNPEDFSELFFRTFQNFSELHYNILISLSKLCFRILANFSEF